MSEAIEQKIIRLNHLAVQLHQQGQYRRALDVARQVCGLSLQHFGKEHPNYATSLTNLAMMYHELSEYNEGEALLRKAMVIDRQTFGAEHPRFADGLNNLGMLYDRMGRYTDAEPLYRKAMEILRHTPGEGHPDFAECLSRLAALYSATGRYDEAEPLYRKAIEIWRRALGENDRRFATGLNNLAVMYYATGKYDQAEPLYRQSMEIRRAVLGEQHPEFATSLNNLGELYRSLGRYEETEPLLRQAMETRRKIFGEEHSCLAESLSNLAKLYYLTDRPGPAESMYSQALAIYRKVLGEEHPDFAKDLSHLGLVYCSMGKYDTAEPLFRQAMEIQRKVLGAGHPDLGATLNNLGELYVDVGRYREAEALLRQSLEIKHTVLGEDHPDCATTLIWLALALTPLGDVREAYRLMQKATEIDNKTIHQVFAISSESQRMNYLETLLGHFSILVSMTLCFAGEDPSAVPACFETVLRRKAIGLEILAMQRDAILGGKYAKLKRQLRELSSLRMQIAQRALGGPGPEGLEAHRRWLSESGVRKELLEYELARQIPEIDTEQKIRAADSKTIAMALPEDSALVEFLCLDVFRFRAVPARKEPPWEGPRYMAFVLPAGRPEGVQMIDLGEARRIEELIARFRDGITKEPGPGEKRRVRSEEDEGSILRKMIFDPIMPAIGERKRLLLAPDGDLTRLPFEVLPVREGRLLIDDYRISYVGTGRDIVRYRDKPTGNPSDPLVIADPDFDLRDCTPLLRRRIGHRSPGERLKHRKEETGQDPSAVPASVARQHSRLSSDSALPKIHFDRLPGTRLEGEQVARMLEVAAWLDVSALEARLKARRSPRILHLATHGYFLEDQRYDQLRRLGMGRLMEHLQRATGQPPENPLLRSGLALSGANTWMEGNTPPKEAEDGLLTAAEVSGLDLFDTELVVLSACDTGLGEVHTGEGVFGLRRSFVLAGARTLVMSLWKVPDKETHELMAVFYQRLLQGQPRAEALREAQLAVRAQHPEPRYWGAFICQGDFRPLPKAGPICKRI